jgi:hypothetical protein
MMRSSEWRAHYELMKSQKADVPAQPEHDGPMVEVTDEEGNVHRAPWTPDFAVQNPEIMSIVLRMTVDRAKAEYERRQAEKDAHRNAALLGDRAGAGADG